MNPPSSALVQTRREHVRFIAAAAAAAVLPRSGAAEPKQSEPFTFIAVNDLHYSTEECGPWFERAVAAMKASAPAAAFCLISGDVSNDGARSQLTAVRDIFAKLNIPIHTTAGNHDFLTATDLSSYEAVFPGPANRRFEHAGWQFLGLDTTQGQKWSGTTIADTTFQWLEEHRPELDQQKPTVVFTHFPLGEGVTYRPVNAAALLEKLFRLNLRGVFSGHWHGSTERKVRGAVLTTDCCCARVRGNHDGSPLKGWFVCGATPTGDLSHRFVEFK